MKTFLIRRMLAALSLIIFVTFITKAMLVLSPGNYLDELRATQRAPVDYIAQMEQKYHLGSKNIFERYWYWIWPALGGDLGQSYTKSAPVTSLIGQRVFNTLLLTGSALIFSWAFAIPLGVAAAVYRNHLIDRLCGFISLFGLSIPSAFFSLLMVLFAAKTKLFPVDNVHNQIRWGVMSTGEKIIDTLHHLVLPTIVLGTIGLAQYMRQMRSEMIETLSQDYIRTARAKGLSQWRVIYSHALPNAINPLVTLFGFSLGFLLGGALLVEYVFSWPGLGTLIYESIREKDEPLIMAAVTMLVLMLVIGNLIADLLLAIIDPRIRME